MNTSTKLERALAYLRELPVAVSGGGGHNATLRAACECFRFGLSASEAWEALRWFNEFRCQPLWKEHELRHKLADAEKIVSGQGQTGKHVAGRAQAPRVFVSPDRPTRKPDTRPVCQRSEAEEELFWARVALELGTTLEEFDERCGVTRAKA